MNLRFTKLNLKNGMVVETRVKERYIFWNNRFMSVDNDHVYIPLAIYSEDLLLSNNEKECEGDIIKVFEPVKTLSQVNTTTKIVWQRGIDVNRTKCLTIDDLE